MDISLLCRGCMQELDSFSSNYDNDTAKMFTFCTKIEISENINLPQQFCNSCLKEIQSCYKFITKALDVHTTLTHLVSDNKIKTDIDESSDDDNPLIEFIKKEEAIYHEPDISSLKYEKDIKVKNYKEINEDVCSTDLSKIYSERSNVCNICSKNFKLKAWFDRHMVKEHSGQFLPGRHNCKLCSKSYVRETSLKKHVKSHTLKPKVYKCKACDKGFTNKVQLRSHAHTHSTTYECNDCSKKYQSKFTLLYHIRVNHDEKYQRQFLCPTCGVSFKKAETLKDHQRTHTGARPFACHTCAARFTQPASLRRHTQRHKGTRLYQCTLCAKKFFTKAELARHTRRHTGECPFKCPLCPRSYVDSWHRKRHLMTSHGHALADIPPMDRAGAVLADRLQYRTNRTQKELVT